MMPLSIINSALSQCKLGINLFSKPARIIWEARSKSLYSTKALLPPSYILNKDNITLQWKDLPTHSSLTTKFHYVWLRDHCPCPLCIHPSTGQKLHSTGEVDLNVIPESVSVTLGQCDPASSSVPVTGLNIIWATQGIRRRQASSSTASFENKHTSFFPLSWLYRHNYTTNATSLWYQKPVQPIPWVPSILQEVNLNISYSDITQCQTVNTEKQKRTEGFWKAVKLLSDYGICFIRQVPIDKTGVMLENIAELFGPIKETFYGRSWDVVAKSNAENIAYTQLPLGIHMDLLYFEAPPGLQFLHCLENATQGGSSTFVDAYKAALKMKALHPKDFELLCEVPITFQYLTNGRFMYHRRPLFSPQAWNDHLHIWYSFPFQGPLDIPENKVISFYQAFQRWEDIVRDPEMLMKVKLEAGDVVVFANRRVLHGREEFSLEPGKCRRLKGTYIEWSDFMEKVRLYRSFDRPLHLLDVPFENPGVDVVE